MLFRPNFYQKNIYNINYQKLKERGIKCLLFDMDNTCVGYKNKKITKELKVLFKDLKKMKFKVIIFSNAQKKRVLPFQNLVDECHPMSVKPFQKSFRYILKKYNLNKEEVCIIGDQLYTDILGGNIAKIYTYLVDPIESEDFIVTKLFRYLEKIIYNKMAKKNILKKGEYYE